MSPSQTPQAFITKGCKGCRVSPRSMLPPSCQVLASSPASCFPVHRVPFNAGKGFGIDQEQRRSHQGEGYLLSVCISNELSRKCMTEDDNQQVNA